LHKISSRTDSVKLEKNAAGEKIMCKKVELHKREEGEKRSKCSRRWRKGK
jgi:hypothetical protein